MGAWGVGTFDNDTACDWTSGLEGVEDLSLVHDAVDTVVAAGSEYLDSDDATAALAACEVVARLQGRWGTRDGYTKTVDAWVAAHPMQPSAELIEKSLAAIDRVLSRPSELLSLWNEGGRNEAWHQAIADLRRRVAGDGPGV